MDGTKRSIRQEMRRRRRALSIAELNAAEGAVAAALREVPAFAASPIVLAYVDDDGEVPTGRVVETAFACSKRVFLPRLIGETMIFAEHRRGADLRPGAYGLREPIGEPLEARDQKDALAFVPLLAWDASGSRLGRGGGHYDRAFAGSTRPACLVGLGYSFQQCAELPRDLWDLRLDWVVSEHGATRCWTGEDASPSRKEGASHHGISDHGAGRHRAGRRAGVAGRRLAAPTS
jgi:5-formyltetrahydrofolate cyclo-ligase